MADTVTVDLRGFREFQTNLKTLARGRKPGPKLRRIVRRAMNKAKTPILKAAKREAPKDKGVLRLSLRAKVGTSGDTVWAIIGPRRGRFSRTVKKKKREVDAFYAHMVEGGTKRHRIPRTAGKDPNRKRFMRFVVGGETVVASVVSHPGTRAQPFLQKAGRAGFTRAKREFTVRFRSELEKAVRV